jgi:selenoprotein W-related protein
MNDCPGHECPGNPGADPEEGCAGGRPEAGAVGPRLAIRYCARCRFLLRATWVAQEVLTTFPEGLGEVALIPGTGGVFEIWLDDRLLFSRREAGRFPESKELKQAIRDAISPGRGLGHSDVGPPGTAGFDGDG